MFKSIYNVRCFLTVSRVRSACDAGDAEMWQYLYKIVAYDECSYIIYWMILTFNNVFIVFKGEKRNFKESLYIRKKDVHYIPWTSKDWQNGRIAQGNFCAHLVLKCDLVVLMSSSLCAHVALKHPEKSWAHFERSRRAQTALTSRSNGEQRHSNGEKSHSWRAISAFFWPSIGERDVSAMWARRERVMSAYTKMCSCCAMSAFVELSLFFSKFTVIFKISEKSEILTRRSNGE